MNISGNDIGAFISNTVEWIFILYTIPLIFIYLFRVFNSLFTNIRYKRKTKEIERQVESLARSPLTVGISIVAPAYNEGATIIDNIRSLLMANYPSYEIIVVNDGSKDDSLKKVIKAYDLEKIQDEKLHALKAKEVIAIYKSKNPSYNNLKVIDKKNGGKSDALNCGINYAKYPLIACMDVDSVFTKNALLKLARPFMLDPEVIATGSAIRIANDCKIELGQLRKVNLPKNIWSRFQVIEYLRAFLLGRMSLSQINGLPLVSGASGLFKKDLVVEVGGYDTSTVGEDMELVIRMRRHCYEQKRKHKVKYIPDPVCWTEAPFDHKTLQKQRNRWTRGSIESLLKHKKMLWNPKYGILGMYSLPYWLLYEVAIPFTILLGLIFVVAAVSIGSFEFGAIINLFLFFYSFSVFVSTFSFMIEELTFRQYSRIKDILILFFLSVIESLVYQPVVIYWVSTGIINKMQNKKVGWGTMTRMGFEKG